MESNEKNIFERRARNFTTSLLCSHISNQQTVSKTFLSPPQIVFLKECIPSTKTTNYTFIDRPRYKYQLPCNHSRVWWCIYWPFRTPKMWHIWRRSVLLCLLREQGGKRRDLISFNIKWRSVVVIFYSIRNLVQRDFSLPIPSYTNSLLLLKFLQQNIRNVPSVTLFFKTNHLGIICITVSY